MGVLVVGTVTLDTIETPNKRVEDVLGGSGIYASVAASFFVNPVRLVGVVGADFPQAYTDFLQTRAVDLEGLTRVENGKLSDGVVNTLKISTYVIPSLQN